MKNIADKEQIDLQKLRRQTAFDRLLSRLFQAYPNELFLKGGYSMELRVQKARATKDIDLILKKNGLENHNKDEIHDKLQEACRMSKNDHFEFQIHEPTLDLEAIPYGGLRFPVELRIEGRLFVRFPIDVVISSLVLDPIENLEHRDWLGFAGIQSIAYPTISKEQQFAEKLHAYTYPRIESENSRVKDLMDMFLLIEYDALNRKILKQAITSVFVYRGTHSVPNNLIEYPEDWILKFDRLRYECGIAKNINECFFSIAHFLKWPVIAHKENQATVPNQSLCHFCGQHALVWMPKLLTNDGASSQTEEMLDCDCKNCGPFRISGMFARTNNSENNSKNWKAWHEFLRKREHISSQRFLLTTLNPIPDFEYF